MVTRPSSKRRQRFNGSWTLLNTHKITGLNMSFGTKLLYFAGYTTDHRPRPLILDERVRASLGKVAPETVPAKGWVRQADYVRYLDLAEEWAMDPLWRQTPEVGRANRQPHRRCAWPPRSPRSCRVHRLGPARPGCGPDHSLWACIPTP